MIGKKKIVAIILAAACLTNLQAQTNMNHIFRKYRNVENAEYVHMPSWLMKIAKTVVSDENDKDDIINKINSIKVLKIDKCPKKIRREIGESFSKLDENVYEPLIKVSEDGEKCCIYIRKEGGDITELDVFGIDDGETAIVQIKGKMTQEDIEKIKKEDGSIKVKF